MAIALDRSIARRNGGGGGGSTRRTVRHTSTSGANFSNEPDKPSGPRFRPGSTVYIYAGQEEDVTVEEAKSALQLIGQGGGLGATLGSVVPGVGQGVGFVVGGLVGSIGKLFGLGGGDEKSVSGFIEQMLLKSVPGAVDRDTWTHLPGEYEPEKMLKAVKDLGRRFQSKLSGDNAGDVGKWIRGLRLSSRSRGAKNVCSFKVAQPPANKAVSSTDDSKSDGVQKSPIRAGLGLAATAILLGAVFSGS